MCFSDTHSRQTEQENKRKGNKGKHLRKVKVNIEERNIYKKVLYNKKKGEKQAFIKY